jgi:hypothetical protein
VQRQYDSGEMELVDQRTGEVETAKLMEFNCKGCRIAHESATHFYFLKFEP